jgi:hypothetical protein
VWRSARSLIPLSIFWFITKLTASTSSTSSLALLDARGEKLDTARLWRIELPSSLSGY